MTEKSTCYVMKQSPSGLPRPVSEEVILEVKDDGIYLLFSVPEPNSSDYTQERFFYSWENNKFNVLANNLLVVIGVPEESINRVPLVITQSNQRCKLVDRTACTMAVSLSEESAGAVRGALRTQGGKVC